MALEELIADARIWRAGGLPPQRSLPTGFPALDALLPGGGWPRGALTELLTARPERGALGLLLPAMARLTAAQRWLTWLAPPWIPYAPALEAAGLDLRYLLIIEAPGRPGAVQADRLWACEQALRSPACGAALIWLERASMPVLRRLQLAAEAGGSWGIVIRDTRWRRQSSPAVLRIALEATATGLSLELVKCRGSRGGRSCSLSV